MSDGPAVGVVGEDVADVAAALEAAGATPSVGPAGEVSGGDCVVAVGEAALLSVARETPAGPVLPVDAGRGVRSVPRDAVARAVAAVLAGDADRETHPVYAVSVGETTRAHVLFDAMLVTAAPAEISEYTVHAGGERVARFRADGVVVATPAGSPGYAHRAGGPVVPPETSVVAVAPVAPFATDADHWVVPPADLRLTVERDAAAVDLVADDRVVGDTPPGAPVGLTQAATVPLAVVDASRSPFDRE